MKRPWNNRLIYKFLFSYLAIVVILSVGFFLYASNLLRDSYVSSLHKVMEQKAWVLARLLPWESEPGSLDSICGTLAQELGVRITVIARDGTVIGDSEEPAVDLENHGSRPEVIEAFSSGRGSAMRYSTSVKHDLLYHAYRQAEGGRQRIVRVAVAPSEIQSVTHSLGRTLFVGVLLCSLLGLTVAYFFSRIITGRINRLVEFSRAVARGEFGSRVFPPSRRDELHVLEQNLHEMSLKIRDNIDELRSEKEKVDSILRCMVEGLLVLDPKGNVLLINEQAKRMFHVNQEQIQTGSFVEISRSPEMRKILQEVMSFDFANRVYSKTVSVDDGRWFRVNAVSLQNDGARPSGSILVFHDITELQRLETVRSDFVANVSHELRTPLTAIRGYVETLLHNPPADPKDSNQFLTIIQRHAARLSRLTEDLLTLSDLESGSLQMAHKPIEAAQLVQRVLEVFWDQSAKKNVKLSQLMAPDLPPIMGDPDRLQQLFINLIDNAMKYTPPGGSVSITASPSRDGQAKLELAIADTGVGIPEKDLPRLTERFYRVDKARSRELGGTGLGLAIVKHILQAHGGELKIESVVQKGTTVRVWLPTASAITQHDATLFLCAENSCRSQMAEAFARQFAPQNHRVFSAGTSPKEIHPLAIQVMKEAGIDISTQRSKGLQAIPLAEIGRLVTLCGEADENCPTLPLKVERFHWPLRDPAAARGNQDEVLRAFREVRDEIRDRVERLFSEATRQHSDSSIREPTRIAN
jgi:two-component system phosphate regulon sensor histidine kinase PhoR